MVSRMADARRLQHAAQRRRPLAAGLRRIAAEFRTARQRRCRSSRRPLLERSRLLRCQSLHLSKTQKLW